MNKNTKNIEYQDLYICSNGPMAKPGSKYKGAMMASFTINSDISFLFPYINAVAKKAELYEKPSLIRFLFEDIYCVLYPERCIASPLNDDKHGRLFVQNLIRFLNDISARRSQIVPKYKLFRKASILNILKILPKTNCRECGFTTCMAFATMLSQQQTIPGRCPYMGLPMNEQAVYPVYDSNGNCLSTITIDIDIAKMNAELQHKSDYIKQLEKKISEQTRDKRENEKVTNNSLPSPLTKREMEVLRMVACGATNTEISHILKISPHTVKSHIIHIFNKLGVNDRTQAAVWAAHQSLI